MYYHSSPYQEPLPRGTINPPAYRACCFITMGVLQIILGVSSMSCGLVQLLYSFGWRPTWYFLGYGIWSGFMMLVVGCVALGAGGQRTKGCACGTAVWAFISLLCCGCQVAFAMLDYSQFISWGFDVNYKVVLLHSIFISLLGSGFFGFIFNFVLIVIGCMGCIGKPLTVEPVQMFVTYPLHTTSYSHGQVMMNAPEMQQGPPMQQNYPEMQNYPYSVK